MTFVYTLLNKKLIIKDNYIPSVKSTLNQFIDLNDNRIFIKIICRSFIK